MSTRVWIVYHDEPYEETETLAVFSNREAAQALFDKLAAERTTAYPFGRNYSMKEFEVRDE
jgi:hypothetical protein